MNEVSEVVNTHVLVFRDRSRMFIPQKVNDFIWTEAAKPNADKIKIGERIVSIRDISKILSVSDFYEQYPREAPDNQYKTFSIEKKTLIDGKKYMLLGFRRYLESTESNPLVRQGCQCGCGSKVFNQLTGNPEKEYERLSSAMNS